MTPEIAIIAALIVSNIAALLMWQRDMSQAHASITAMCRYIDELHRNSHRRDPRTGRIMPKGA